MFYGFRCRTWEIENRCLTTAFTTIGIRYRYEIGSCNIYTDSLSLFSRIPKIGYETRACIQNYCSSFANQGIL